VSRRTHEIGIRMALGARAADVMAMVLRDGAKLAVVGVALGVVAAFGLSRLVESLLYGVAATDPAPFACVAAGLFAVALLASCVPARRAMRTDPMQALRDEHPEKGALPRAVLC